MEKTNIVVCINCKGADLIKDYRYGNLRQWSWKCIECQWEDRRINTDTIELSREFNGVCW